MPRASAGSSGRQGAAVHPPLPPDVAAAELVLGHLHHLGVRALGGADGGKELGVVRARAHGDRHRHGVAEHEHLLLRVEGGEDAAEGRRARRADEHRREVAVVGEGGDELGADLAQHLVVDGARALIHHEEARR